MSTQVRIDPDGEVLITFVDEEEDVDELDDELDYDVDDEEFADPMIEADPEEAEVSEDDAQR